MTAPDSLTLWPTGLMDPASFATLWDRVGPAFLTRMEGHRIDAATAFHLAGVYLPLAAWIDRQLRDGTLVVGISGGQGSGKSTLAELVGLVLEFGFRRRTALLSIDDVYRTGADRQRLAEEIHPLLRTRGVPGTHDPELALKVMAALRNAAPHSLTALPSFDKARDERRPETAWSRFRGRPDVILFEGWCVGTLPQTEAELGAARNYLERKEDPEGVWRHWVNQQLMGPYRTLFDQLDRLIFLQAPGMESIFHWRSLQERKLAARTGAAADLRLMDDLELRRFVMHYERITRHNFATLPHQADVTLDLDETHAFTGARLRAS